MSYTVREIANRFNLSEKAVYAAIAKNHITLDESNTTKNPRYTKASVLQYWSRRLPGTICAIGPETVGYFVPLETFEAIKKCLSDLQEHVNEFDQSDYYRMLNQEAMEEHRSTGYTSKQIVEKFGVSVRTVYAATQRGKLIRIPGTQIYTKESVETHWSRKLEDKQSETKE